MTARGGVEEEVAVEGGLLDHVGVQLVAIGPLLLVAVVGGNHAREVRLAALVGRAARPVVEEDGGGDQADRDVEAGLPLERRYLN